MEYLRRQAAKAGAEERSWLLIEQFEHQGEQRVLLSIAEDPEQGLVHIVTNVMSSERIGPADEGTNYRYDAPRRRAQKRPTSNPPRPRQEIATPSLQLCGS